MTDQQFIYVVKDLRKIVPPKREILKGIWLSFFHGAKIGVVGPNGSGKSTLLKIMAGLDDDFLGEAWAAKGTKIGYLPQAAERDAALAAVIREQSHKAEMEARAQQIRVRRQGIGLRHLTLPSPRRSLGGSGSGRLVFFASPLPVHPRWKRRRRRSCVS